MTRLAPFRSSVWPRRWLLVIVPLAAMGILLADHATGERFSLSFLFAPLVAVAAWRFGVGVALTLVAAVSLATVLVDYVGARAPGAVRYAAGAVRLVALTSLVLLVRGWKRGMEGQRQLAERDVLTGLASRQQLFAGGERELARARKEGTALGALFVDCDHFKAINDRWGHSAGDELLREAGDAIRAVVRPGDLAARLGGDEFVVISRGIDGDGLRLSAERLQAEFARRMSARNSTLTLSIGAALFQRPPETLDEVIAAADELMYAVKHNRRDGIEFCEFDAVATTGSRAPT